MSHNVGDARAYVNHGRVIADCPRPHCNNATLLTPNQTTFRCKGAGGCDLITGVEWPSNLDELLEELGKRPVKATRNWFPPFHDLAMRAGAPHGQTVKELQAEHEHFGKEA